MRTIEAKAIVSEDGKLTIQLPPDIPPGEHRIVLVIEELISSHEEADTKDFPVIDIGPWPTDLSLRREDMYDERGR